jgi:hypothetical protein
MQNEESEEGFGPSK